MMLETRPANVEPQAAATNPTRDTVLASTSDHLLWGTAALLIEIPRAATPAILKLTVGFLHGRDVANYQPGNQGRISAVGTGLP